MAFATSSCENINHKKHLSVRFSFITNEWRTVGQLIGHCYALTSSQGMSSSSCVKCQMCLSVIKVQCVVDVSVSALVKFENIHRRLATFLFHTV